MYTLEATFPVQYTLKLITMFVLMIFPMSLEMGYIGSKPRSLGQIIEELMLVTKGLWFTSMHFNAVQHDLEGSGEQLQGHNGPSCLFYRIGPQPFSMACRRRRLKWETYICFPRNSEDCSRLVIVVPNLVYYFISLIEIGFGMGITWPVRPCVVYLGVRISHCNPAIDTSAISCVLFALRIIGFL